MLPASRSCSETGGDGTQDGPGLRYQTDCSQLGASLFRMGVLVHPRELAACNFACCLQPFLQLVTLTSVAFSKMSGTCTPQKSCSASLNFAGVLTWLSSCASASPWGMITTLGPEPHSPAHNCNQHGFLGCVVLYISVVAAYSPGFM